MQSEPEVAPDGSAPCILIVEDEVLIRTFIAEMLRDEGFGVIEAASADEAWAYLQAGGHTDLVFSDIDMPGSMNGLGLGGRLKADYPGLPLILTSGGAKAGVALNMGKFLAKPFKLDEMLGMISSLLDKHEGKEG
jgi:DNA-binding NtrC family response regulator